MNNEPLLYIDARFFVVFPGEWQTKNLLFPLISAAKDMSANVIQDKPWLAYVWNGRYGRVHISSYLSWIRDCLKIMDQRIIEGAVIPEVCETADNGTEIGDEDIREVQVNLNLIKISTNQYERLTRFSRRKHAFR